MSQRRETVKEKKLPTHLKAYNDLVDRLEEVRPRAEEALEEHDCIVRGLEAISPTRFFKENGPLPKPGS